MINLGLKKSTKVHKDGVKTGQKQSKKADCGPYRGKSYKRRNEPENGAGDATRTRDIFLGKEVLYQLSYTRNWCMRNIRETRGF